MLGTDSGWADPIIVDVDAHLEHDFDGLVAAGCVPVDDNAALLPGMDHVLLTDPFVSIHNAIMGLLVQIDNVLKTDVDALVVTAQTAELLALLFLGELGSERLAVGSLHSFAFEEVDQVLIADLVFMNAKAHRVHEFVHVLLADELVVNLEAASVFECVLHIFAANLLAFVVDETACRHFDLVIL